MQIIITTGLILSIVSVTAEAISATGSDNLSLPLLSALTLDVLLNAPFQFHVQFIFWILITFCVVTIAYKFAVLQLSGAFTAFLLGIFVLDVGSVQWMVPMAVFFGFSSLLSKIGSGHKNTLNRNYEKTSNRDMMQVLDNGGIAGILVIFWYYARQPVFYFAFLGGLAAATADTWATELGAYSTMQPRSILSLQPVKKGTYGGITFLGSIGALLGASVLVVSSWISSAAETNIHFPFTVLLFITTVGFIASFFDSILGASVQGQYQCDICGKITEKSTHRNNQNQIVQGLKKVNNDVVNLFCTTFGAIVVLLFL